MASLVGSVFEEYSTLSAEERERAVNSIGESVSYINAFAVGTTPVEGTDDNDLYLVDETTTGGIDEDADGGEDVVVSSTDYVLPKHVETLILTGSEDLYGEGNTQDNVIAGNDGENTLDGGKGDDLVLGGLGDDYIKGDTGNDTLIGGEGDDSILGGAGADTLEGGIGNDTMDGGNERDVMDGGEGDDSLLGGNGDDTIFGGADNDTIFGGNGDDSIEGGEGNDYIDGGNGKDTILGGLGDDTMLGDGGADVFYFGLAGNDTGNSIIEDFKAGVDVIGVELALDTIPDILASTTSNLDGDAVVTIGDKTVTLVGIDEDDVDNSFFHIS